MQRQQHCKEMSSENVLLVQLRNFGVSPKTMEMFYYSFIESDLTSCLVCWLGILSKNIEAS